MEREQLARAVREPGGVAREDLVGLKAMAERYPWFSGAHLLLAVGEHASGEVLYDDTLARAAAHLPSREALFNLTEQAAPPPLPPVETATAPVITDPVAPSVVVEDPAPLPPVEAVAPVMPMPEEAQIQPKTELPPVEEAAAASQPADDVLDQQILEAALSSAYDLTWQESVRTPVQSPPPDNEAAPPIKVVDMARPPAPASVLPAVEAAVPEHVPDPEPRPTITRASRLRFTDWLSAGPEAPVAPVHAPVAPAIVAVPLRLREAFGEARPPVEAPAPKSPSEPAPAADAKALIDRFIQQDAPPPPPKTAFYTPQQAAKRSLDDTAGLVTETLARIYEKQGNLPKAIEAYRRLALKHPEKSAYFAALQKKLEEQSNK